jgi:molybdopterin molybdotransferase
MWFGRKEQVTVFALPGNPVSSLMCATRYLVPWIKKLSGKNNQIQTTLLGDEYELRGSLTQFAAVKISSDAGGQRVAHIIKNNGSGDYASLSGADGFVELSAVKKTYSKNDQVDLYLF